MAAASSGKDDAGVASAQRTDLWGSHVSLFREETLEDALESMMVEDGLVSPSAPDAASLGNGGNLR